MIVEWVSANDLQAIDEERARMEPSSPLKRSPKKAQRRKDEDLGSGVGSEEWREEVGDAFIESQKEQFLPRVMFAVGTTRECACSR